VRETVNTIDVVPESPSTTVASLIEIRESLLSAVLACALVNSAGPARATAARPSSGTMCRPKNRFAERESAGRKEPQPPLELRR
jgi:hypothetical protein